MLRTAIAITGFSFLPFLSLAQGVGTPPNDYCEQGIPITCGAFVSGSTETATEDAAPECVTAVTAPGVWYTFTGLSGTVILSTCADHGYDTKINVYTGDCDDLICVAGNDDGPNACYPGSEVVMVADAATTYRVLVQGYDGATGTFSLSLDCPVCQPPGDVTVAPGDTMALAYWAAANPGAQFHIEYGPPGFTPGTGTVVTGLVGVDGPPATMGGLASGTDYELYLYEDCGGGQVSVTRGPVPFTTASDPLAANAFCANAAAITCGASIQGNTQLGIYSPAPWCGAADVTTKGVWYGFIGDGSEVTLSTCGQAAYDSKISVFSGTCVDLHCVAGNDDGAGCAANTSYVTFPTSMGTNYFVMVHGYEQNMGEFTLSMTCATPCAPAVPNDDCANATTVVPQLTGTCIPMEGTNLCAYMGSMPNPPCDPYAPVNDVWYVVNTGPSTDHTITVTSVTSAALGIALYTGCGPLDFMECHNSADGPIALSGLLANTDYYIRIWTDASGDAGTFTICDEASTLAGVAETRNAEGVRVWPVPAADILNVDGLPSGARSLTLLDASGRAVLTQRVNGTGVQRIDLGTTRPGVYMLMIQGLERSALRVTVQ